MKSISCKEAVEYILKKEEHKLSLVQQIGLWRHLAICKLCRIFSAENSQINQAMKHRKTREVALSDAEKEKIIRHVLDQQEP